LYGKEIETNRNFDGSGSMQNKNLNFPAIKQVNCSSVKTENIFLFFYFGTHRMCGKNQILIFAWSQSQQNFSFSQSVHATVQPDKFK